jgi:hypothetical protein
MYTYIRVYTHAHTHIHILVYTHTYVLYVRAYIHVHMNGDPDQCSSVMCIRLVHLSFGCLCLSSRLQGTVWLVREML